MTHLHLVDLPLRPREFTQWALTRGYLTLPRGDGSGRPREAELGYALHAALTGLFGEEAPRPFDYPVLGSRDYRRNGTRGIASTTIDVMGYTRSPITNLRAVSQFSRGDLEDIVHWERARSKPMPSEWPKDLRLRFGLRACPVRRLLRPLRIPSQDHREVLISKGSEVDAYQVAASRAAEAGEPLPTRERAYVSWLEERLATPANDGPVVSLVPESLQVNSFRSVRLLRRPRSRQGHVSAQWLTRPDVRFTGLLQITQPTRFPHLLTSGIGRHCGFGFGMLLLSPA